MRARTLPVVLGALTAAVVASGARGASAQTAQPGSYAIDHFEPAERGSDWFSADSLDLRGSFRPAVGLTADYSYRQLSILNPDLSLGTAVVKDFFVLHPGASMVLWDRVRLGFNVPILVLATGDNATLGTVTLPAPTASQALGDIRVGADVRLFGEYGDVITGALGAQLWIPTGDQGAYMSDSQARVAPRAQVAGDVGPIAYAAHVSWIYRGASAGVAGYGVGQELKAGAAVGVRLDDRHWLLGPEVFTSTILDHGEAFIRDTSPFEWLVGAHYFMDNGLRFGLSGGRGSTEGVGSPQVRLLGSVEWSQPVHKEPADRDHDGVADDVDACPDVPGVATTDPKTNGCPPPPPLPDRDKDGIVDASDACPDVPGVATNDPKTNGCPPVKDRDNDGVPDDVDACPDVPGVATADPKTNGCPADRDKDGVPDLTDACPDVPGVATSDPKTNGCPGDRDKDGIADNVDACPDEPGPPDSDPKRNGCPKAFVKDNQIVILDQVKFKTGSAEILPGKDSEDVLSAVLKVLTDHKEIGKVRVEGHTDDRGGDTINKPLSASRAASVVKWLTQHGVDKKRLTSEGFGATRPLQPNTSEDGRRVNRRVEFHIEAK